MISYISWKIIDIDYNSVDILTKCGVAYEIIINEKTYSKIYSFKEASLFIYHNITENSESLFWFTSKDEKKVFKELIKISGIGWKVAIQILSIWVSTFLEAIKNEDNKIIESIKWIGKKMAEKIILELKWKDFWIDFVETKQKVNFIDKNLYDSIKSTLVSMWYNFRDIEKILDNMPKDYTIAEDIIPFVIKELS